MINLEVKGTVAKLLAQENLIVEHRKVRTAQFNVDTRVLTLPIWEKATDAIFDMLVAHEVGHALYTPNEDWTENVKVPQQFVNVTEDARIEKLIKRRFPGLAKTFFKGYKELHEMDFFSIADEDLNKMNLADRANLWFKIGKYSDIPIQRGEEMDIINAIADAETFEDALIAAELLYAYCKKQNNSPKSEQKNQEDLEEQQSSESNSANSSSSSSGSDFDSNGTDSDDDFDEGDSNNDDTDGNMGSDQFDEPNVNTADSLEDKLQDLINHQSRDYYYYERPVFDLEDTIISNEQINSDLENHWATVYVEQELKDEFLGRCDSLFKEYKNSAQKEVNYIVKEFECKKSADSYARATTSRTGILDCTKLHTYKYNEDLFKKVSVVPDGKNHGLIFVLDWSGSMGNIMGSTVKQLLNLVWFCRKVNIPFRVYGFTSSYCCLNNENGIHPSKPVNNSFWIDKEFRMLEFLTSEGSNKDFERQCINFWRLVSSVSNDVGAYCHILHQYGLSGTPLNEALLSLHDIIPQFKNETGAQKIQTIILTDGDAQPLLKSTERYTYNKDIEICPARLREDGSEFLRDRKLRTTYKFESWVSHTTSILKNLQDNFSQVNFIGIRLTSPNEFNRFVKHYTFHRLDWQQYEKYSTDFKNNKAAAIDIPAFAKFFCISSNNLNQDASFEVEEGAKKSTIRAAFKKSLTKSKFNRKILSEFVELIA